MFKRIMVLGIAAILAVVLNFAAPAKAGGGGLSYRIFDVSGNRARFFVQGVNDPGTMIANQQIVVTGQPTRTYAFKGNGTTWGRLRNYVPLTNQQESAFASSLNNAGLVVGSSLGRAAIWNGSAISEVPGWPDMVNLTDVNDGGKVTGRLALEDGRFHGIRLDLKTGDFIPLKGTADSQATALNSTGDFTGFERAATATNRSAFLFRKIEGLERIEIGEGNDINASKTVVGHVGYPPAPFFKKVNQGLVRLAVSGIANGINDDNQVVGKAGPGAFVYTEETGLVNLNSVIYGGVGGWILSEAKAINNNGWIVGWGTLNGVQKSFLLVPVEG